MINSLGKIDGDNPEHIEWVYQTALERANEFNIGGVTKHLTLGVVKILFLQ